MADTYKKKEFLERSQVFWCPLNNVMCDRSECFSKCPVCDHWCLMFDQMFDLWTRNFVSLLSDIDFQCYDHWCLMLRPLSVHKSY